MSSPKDNDHPQVDLHQFYFETPLYSAVPLESFAESPFEGEVDAWSPANQIETTYRIRTDDLRNAYYGELAGYSLVRLTCKRKGEILKFFLRNTKVGLLKVGQQPSLADMQFEQVQRKYSKVLDKENLFLLKRAIGLAAHGTGAGSFVYLRRIFEGLIKNAYDTSKNNLGVTEENFVRLRMSEKVSTLADYLPDELPEMTGLYSVLSRGVHELTEDECLEYFPILQLSIELILDKRIEDAARAKRAGEVKKKLQQVTANIENKDKE